MSRDQREKRKLARSPLIVVLTEVRFSPILSIGTLIPTIQEDLRRSGFPGFTTALMHQFQLGINGGEPSFQATQRWVFTSKDGYDTVTLTTEGLSMQTTRYEDFETFLTGVQKVIEVVSRVADPSYADRIGLRYVDAVPNVDDRLKDYFNETVLTFSASDLGVVSLLSNQYIVATTEIGHLQIRMSQVENSPLLPPDLNTPELASVAATREGVHAVLDIDSSDERRFDFGWDSIEERLWGVHAYASSAFWKTITKNAREVWGEMEEEVAK